MTHAPITSQRFCCKYCQSDVAIEVEIGGDLSYVCQNEHCKWACSVDCPEALHLKMVERVACSVDCTSNRPNTR